MTGKWSAEVRKKDWKKIGQKGAIAVGLIAGNVLGGGVLIETHNRMERIEAEVKANTELGGYALLRVCLTDQQIGLLPPTVDCEELISQILEMRANRVNSLK